MSYYIIITSLGPLSFDANEEITNMIKFSTSTRHGGLESYHRHLVAV